MPTVSAGLLLYRRRGSAAEVLLVHPGGPYWARKDEGAWSVPKGLVEPGEDEHMAAWREFREETGFEPGSVGDERDLGTFRLPSGKRLHVWAVEADCEPAALVSNLFELEWPPKSGQMQRFPEVDRAAWLTRDEAFAKISPGQRPAVAAFYAGLERGAPGGG
ncbi:MAG TPA: NUDIX domain-containing protein [Steroidobacteraceae bacterium]|nr:NUDIX domain-containing protein [Steroidobacteraceae bacterium]